MSDPTLSATTHRRISDGVRDQFPHRPGATGRPALEPSRRRRNRVRVALTDTELTDLRARAARAGRRLGPHLRACALAGNAQAAELIQLLVQMLGQARGVSSNLNQASHRANLLLAIARESAGSLDVAALEEEQRAITSALKEIRAWMADVRHVVALLTGGERT